MKSALAPALTGAAAAQVGDRARAEYGFSKARDICWRRPSPVTYPHDTYGSLLRDLSGTMALAAESGKADLVPALLDKVKTLDMRLNDTTTQEKGWMLRAAYELTRQKLPLNITVNGKPAAPRDGAVRLAPTPGAAGRRRHPDQQGRCRRVAFHRRQRHAQCGAAGDGANGFTLTKSMWTMSGAPADLATLHQNDRVIVEISGQMPNDLYHQMGVIDLLPAGLEIEQPLAGDDAKAYTFLGALTDTSRQDARDDRFVAAFDIGDAGSGRPTTRGPSPTPAFHVAYIARAVTVGKFAMPAASVEDMYAPAIRARTAMGQMSIGP